MRSVCCLGLVLMLILFGVACDNDPVSQVEEAEFSLSFRAVGGKAHYFAVWDMIEVTRDDQGNGGQTYLWCEDFFLNPLPGSISVPWPYGIEVELIRAGSTVVETVSSPAALNPINVAEYSTNASFPGLVNNKAPVTVDSRTFNFSNPRVENAATEAIMMSTSNPLATLMGAGRGAGLCSNGNPGPTSIDGSLQQLTVTLAKGDTLIIKAALADDPGDGNGLADLFDPPTNAPIGLLGNLLLDGRDITNDVTGQISGNTVSFHYTSR